MYSNIVVSGNRITITVPIAFTGSGASDANIARAISGIQSAWTGKFGKYDVETRVTSTVEGQPGNHITLDNEGMDSKVFGATNLFGNEGLDVGLNSGVWSTQDADAKWIAGHETGHLMGLDDRYSRSGNSTTPLEGWGGNIMANRGGVAEERNIDAILASGTNQVTRTPDAWTSFWKGFADMFAGNSQQLATQSSGGPQ